MPLTGTALIIALTLVPGYLFLQWTRKSRRPEKRSPVAEVLEILAVGAGTTGLAGVIALLATPGFVMDVLVTLQTPPVALTDSAVRAAALLSLVVGAMSILLAWIFSRMTLSLAKRRYSPSVLHATLGQSLPHHGPLVAIGLTDGSTVDGFLHAYSLGDDETTRTIALKSPLRRQSPTGTQTDLPKGYFLAFGSDIKHLTMQQVPVPNVAASEAPQRKEELDPALGVLTEHVD